MIALRGLALALLLLLPAHFAIAADSHSLVRVHEDGSGLARSLVREAHDIAAYQPGGWIDLVVTGEEAAALTSRSIPYTVRIESLDEPFQKLRDVAEFGAFHTYAEMEAVLDSLATLYPSIAMRVDIGDSFEGREIWALKISDNVALTETEPKVLYTGCHHAREIMTPEIPLLFARHLLENYGIDSQISGLVDDREIWIVPMLNPDGHQHVVDHDPWWRKNRRPNADSTTIGVDLNRNYGFMWGVDDIGSSPDGSSYTYRGEEGFSEPETRAVRDLMRTYDFSFALHFHSYGDWYLYGWGHERLATPHQDVFVAAGDSMTAANGYAPGNAYNNLVYITNGGSDDWAYADTIGRSRCFSFTPEVGSSFAISADSIAFHYAENLPAMMFALRHAADPLRLGLPGPPAIDPLPVDDDGNYTVSWARGDGDTNITSWELLEMTGAATGIDSAESGMDNWITSSWTLDPDRKHSGAFSFLSGGAENENRIMEARHPLHVFAGDSLTFWTRWRMEEESDYWFVEVSTDGGRSYRPVEGSITTNSDPNGNNPGNGMTGSSGWVRAAFDLSSFIDSEIRIRFRAWTDEVISLRGVNIDDIRPVRLFASMDTLGSALAGASFPLSGREDGTYHYVVRGMDDEGNRGYPSPIRSVLVQTITAIAGGTASNTWLGLNSPNPFNPETTIRFSLSKGSVTFFEIYDIAGRLVRTLLEQSLPSGEHEITWNGTNDNGDPVSSGIYLSRLRSGKFDETKRLVLLR